MRSYPEGRNWGMYCGGEGEEGKIGGIKDLGWFTNDPIYGEQSPALSV